MIIKGGSRSNGGFFAKHLTNDRDEERGNGRVELCEMRGVTAHTVDGFFRETAAVASGTRCKNFFYHANINPERGEVLTPEQWREAVDTLEKNLGLEGQPRFVMEHEKEGRIHRHVIWSRIDLETMTARDDSLTYPIHERTSRELENRFDLVRGHSVLDAARETTRPERRPQDWEGFRGQQSGIDPQAMKAELTGLWQTTDSGRAFAAAIEERGYVLARGDRRAFVIVDHAGGDHSLARRLQGVKAAEVAERLADIDPRGLPSVTEAREAQQERFTRDGVFDRDAAAEAWRDRPAQSFAAEAREPEPEPAREAEAPPVHLAGDDRSDEDARAKTGLDSPEVVIKTPEPEPQPTTATAPERSGPDDREVIARSWLDRVAAAVPGRIAPEPDVAQVRAAEAQPERAAGDVASGRSPPEIPEVVPERPADPQTWQPTRDTTPEFDIPETRAPSAEEAEAERHGLTIMSAGARVFNKLADIVADILTLGDGSAPPPGPRNFHLEQLEARERAAEAMDNIRLSLERNQVNVEDLQRLPREHLLTVAGRGEEALREMTRRDDDDRGRTYGWDRER